MRLDVYRVFERSASVVAVWIGVLIGLEERAANDEVDLKGMERGKRSHEVSI